MKKYEKMVVIFVDLLGTKNNKEFEDKYLIHRLFQIAMFNTSISLLRILNAGYLVRGGIAFGDAYFDELGFFGPAVEEAYGLESNYADVPIIALNPELGSAYCEWENLETNMELVNWLMVSRPTLVEVDAEKYFLNLFYQLEAATSSLRLEYETVELEEIKKKLFEVISRDKAKYKDIKKLNENKRLSIYEKLDWFEQYLRTKHNRLNPDIVQGAFSAIYKVD